MVSDKANTPKWVFSLCVSNSQLETVCLKFPLRPGNKSVHLTRIYSKCIEKPQNFTKKYKRPGKSLERHCLSGSKLNERENFSQIVNLMQLQ